MLVREYIKNSEKNPLVLYGDALNILKDLPDGSVDFVMTSPPYWGMREYAEGGIGLEKTLDEYVSNLGLICAELKRVLKDTGSFWLNIGDSYSSKKLMGVPWRVALKLMDEQGWILRNQVVWNKVKGGPDNSKDKLGNIHEPIFHFVKKTTGYYYNADAIRKPPAKSKVVNGAVVSATGVTGVRYKRQIELSTLLKDSEKKEALSALQKVLQDVEQGEIADFRMVIRGVHRTTHSDSKKLSGRAKELHDKGYYFLKYHKNGSKLRDVWDIIPEDTQKRKKHYAVYPLDLCRIPILATCPENGVVLDPFVGTGTTLVVAKELGRKSIGIDISKDYVNLTNKRLK